MYIIGLTGGIATGKTTVANALRAAGAPVVDADALSRALTAPGGQALPKIRARFGDAVFTGDALDRKALAALVFSDAEQREALNAIIHPLVFAALDAQLQAWTAAGVSICVVEMPLLFETGYDARVDEIWVTALPPDLQLARLMARDNLTREQAEARLASQWPTADKLALAQVCIDTSGAPEHAAEQAHAAWLAVLARKGEPLDV